MSTKLEDLEIEVKSSEVQRIPLNTVELPVEDALKILNLVDKFEEDDDVQNVYHNMEITDELVAEMEHED
jgi:transcriptional/translational regulatory protein YebC/TACO1